MGLRDSENHHVPLTFMWLIYELCVRFEMHQVNLDNRKHCQGADR